MKLIKDDPTLIPYQDALQARYHYFTRLKDSLIDGHGSLKNAASWYYHFGIHPVLENGRMTGWLYREWAPSALALFLYGDLNNWNRESLPLQRKANGEWEIFLPFEEFKDKLLHQSRYKVRVMGGWGDQERIPLFCNRAVQCPFTQDFSASAWLPSEPYQWKNQNFRPDRSTTLKIYEAHVGMASEEQKIASFDEFRINILPRIKWLGYNAIQLMAIQEHPYYGSFGYQVSNFFGVSSRFGTPDELKALVDAAHGMGIAVIMDLVHSHSAKNTREGICGFDGTVWQFFHDGPKGDHWLWGSKVFNYGQRGVLRFLLSNVRYWLEEYQLDGFRFDGVTSMLYEHHGLGVGFGHYDTYFQGVDGDAIAYLQLATSLMKEITPHAIAIAEDVSGMPGLCRPIDEGGMGFDYRLSMGLPDFWIKTLKEKRDEDWSVFDIWGVMLNRRKKEGHIAYVECHDQAIVGDKTVAMWLMNADIYFNMRTSDNNHVVERGIALHKMIRFVTLLLGGEAYLTFMGNEFGHPEWIDFPREGNGWSHYHARRMWSLADNLDLKYHFLKDFDQAMIHFDHDKGLGFAEPHQIHMDDHNKIMVFEKADLLFIFNFNPQQSFFGYRIGVPKSGKYMVALNTDSYRFGGHGRVHEAEPIFSQPQEWHGQKQSIQVYIPHRTALVLELIKEG